MVQATKGVAEYVKMIDATRSLKFMVFAVSLAYGINSEARIIQNLEIKGTGLTTESDERTKELCKAFKPTLSQVWNYFNRAYHVESYIDRAIFALHCIRNLGLQRRFFWGLDPAFEWCSLVDLQSRRLSFLVL